MRLKLSQLIARRLLLASACVTVLAFNGCGGGGLFSRGGDSPGPSLYMYCTNAFSYDISLFKIGAGGHLSTLAPNVGYTTNRAFFPGSESLQFDPSHTHAYLANLGASTIDEFRVNKNGTLTEFGSYVMDQGANSSEPSIIVFLPSGKVAYATSESRTNHKLTELTVNADGSLAPLGTIDTGNDVGHIVLDPQGRYLYVTSYFGNTVSRYPINANGTLGAAITPLPTGAGPFAQTMTPNGAYLYITNLGTLFPPYAPIPGTISEYKVNVDGSLTSIGSINTGTGPGFLTVSADNRFAYVGNLHDTTVMVYSIHQDGTLSLVQLLPVGNGPVQITMSPDGKFAYVAQTGADANAPQTGANTLLECKVNSDGTLTPFGSVNTGFGPDFMLVLAKAN